MSNQIIRKNVRDVMNSNFILKCFLRRTFYGNSRNYLYGILMALSVEDNGLRSLKNLNFIEERGHFSLSPDILLILSIWNTTPFPMNNKVFIVCAESSKNSHKQISRKALEHIRNWNKSTRWWMCQKFPLSLI